MLLQAFVAVRARHPAAQLVLVPHEPHESALAHVTARAAALGLPVPARLASATGPVSLLLVDRVGVLAALYGAGTMAWVGGGFGRAGLHSVLEPAAWGLPIATGPNWAESRDAVALQRAGAAVDTADGLAARWLAWIEGDAERCRQGALARALAARGRGAAERSADLLDALLAR